MKNIRKLLKLDEMALIFTEQNRFYLTGFASSYMDMSNVVERRKHEYFKFFQEEKTT